MTAVLNSLGPISINSTTYPVLSIDQQFATIVEPAEHTGQLYPHLQLIRGAVPQLTVTMPLQAAYDLVGLKSLSVTAMDIWLAKYGSDGAKSTSTDHRKLSLDTGQTALATITTISVAQDGLATADVQITCRSSDGQTHPLVAGTGTLPTLSAQPTLHTMGPVALQGTAIDGAAGWSIDLAQTVQPERSDGDLYPTVVAYRGGSPTISVDHNSPENIMAVLDLIGESAGANTVLYARRHDTSTGLVVGGATAVSITLADGWITPESVAAAQDGLASIPLSIAPQTDTVDVHPLTVSTSATAP